MGTVAPMSTERLHDLLPMVWCRTCEHEHIPAIPAVTFRCASDCGFGVWDLTLAARHADLYPDHIVYPLHHQTISLEEADAECWDIGGGS